MPIKAVVWGENVHEQTNAAVRDLYPLGMHGTIAAALNQDKRIEATTATLQEPEHGLSEPRLAATDVLIGGAMPPMARSRTRSSNACRSGSGKGWG